MNDDDNRLSIIPDEILDDLTYRQRMFVTHYISEEFQGNAVQSAIAAGYTGSYNVIGVTAHGLLKNSKIQAAIKSYATAVISEHEVISRLAKYVRRQDVPSIERNAWVQAVKLLLEYHGALNSRTSPVSVNVTQVKVTALQPVNPYMKVDESVNVIDSKANETHNTIDKIE